MFARFLAPLLVGFVAAFGVTTAAMAGENFEGKVLTVSEDRHLTIMHGDDQKTFVIDEDTKITLDGEAARWEDVKPGFTVVVDAQNEGDRFLARSIAAYADE